MNHVSLSAQYIRSIFLRVVEQLWNLAYTSMIIWKEDSSLFVTTLSRRDVAVQFIPQVYCVTVFIVSSIFYVRL